MYYIMYFLFFIVVLGLIGVASNPPLYFGVLSLVVVAGVVCIVLVCLGVSFLSMVLLLIYLGGMMVVFAYSVAFAISMSLEGWSGGSILSSVMLYIFSLCVIAFLLLDEYYADFWGVGINYYDYDIVRGTLTGVSMLYSLGGLLLVIGVLGLLLVLFVVLSVIRGYSLGMVRKT